MEANDFVRELLERGMTQEKIAARVGVRQPMVSKIHRGAIADVSSKNYRKLQALYDEVIGGRGPAPTASAAVAEG